MKTHKDRRTTRLLNFVMLAALGLASMIAFGGVQVAEGGGEIPTKPPTVVADGGGPIPTDPNPQEPPKKPQQKPQLNA